MSNVVRQVEQNLLFEEMRNVLSQGCQVQLRVRGRSMRPMLEHERDSVTLQQEPVLRYGQGDVVLAHTTDARWVLHRIVQCDDTRCVLQGDGNVGQQEQCLRTEILGRVVYFERKSKRYAANHVFWRVYANFWQRLVLVRRPLLLGYELLHRFAVYCSHF
ncbi:MAG: hypothetical protein D8H91_01400 [Alloprevotella sp.]|nr:MAG: hypothetical protein D8H91_01400 [Alloprevotella sp.]